MLSPHDFVYRTVTVYGGPFQTLQLSPGTTRACFARLRGDPTTPRWQRTKALHAIGVWAVARSLAATRAISALISVPAGTEMFHFPACRSHRLWIQRWVSRHDAGGVTPFGDPRINACLRLPEAYRSLLRPSSPVEAKASTVSPS